MTLTPAGENRFETSPNRKCVRLALAVIFFSVGAAALVYVYVAPPPAASTKVKAHIVGGLLVAASIALATNGLRSRIVVVTVGKDGIRQEQEGLTEACRWSEVGSVVEKHLV